MENRILFSSYDEMAELIKALNSPLRRKMLQLLYHRKLNINQIAEELQVHQSTCTVNIQMLEKVGLVLTEQVSADSKGSQKLCTSICDEVVIPLQKEQIIKSNSIVTEMPIGLFSNFDVHPTCGMVSETGIIGYFDNQETFLDPQRAKAQLIWLSRGYLEYGFPKKISTNTKINSITFKTEICSEYPGNNSNWPSDISLWINGVEIGTWTSPGDMANFRGKLTPSWWPSKDSQYGFLKAWKITDKGSLIDGEPCSSITIKDLKINEYPQFTIRIGIKEDAHNQGGINIYGEKFGNYEQNLLLQIDLKED